VSPPGHMFEVAGLCAIKGWRQKLLKTTRKITPWAFTVPLSTWYYTLPGPQRRCWAIRETPPTIHLLPILCKKVAPADNRHWGKSSPQKWQDRNQYLLMNKATAQEKDPKRQGLAGRWTNGQTDGSQD